MKKSAKWIGASKWKNNKPKNKYRSTPKRQTRRQSAREQAFEEFRVKRSASRTQKWLEKQKKDKQDYENRLQRAISRDARRRAEYEAAKFAWEQQYYEKYGCTYIAPNYP